MKLTEKLGLKKPDLTDYVNIEDLNDNMDILDGEVGSLKEGTTEVVDLETLDKTYKGAINEINQEVKSHKAESATIKHTAKEIGLDDLPNNFTAVNVEGAMNELFTNVSNGKDLVSGAITGVDSSIVAPTNPTFGDLANLIGSISTGKKYAEGSGRYPQRYSYTTTIFKIEVRGLAFSPKYIIIKNTTTSTTRSTREYVTVYAEYTSSTFMADLRVGLRGETNSLSNVELFGDGFSIAAEGDTSDDNRFSWIAFE